MTDSPTPGLRPGLLAGLVAVAVLAACQPLGRPGAPCQSADECAWGLVCVAGNCHRNDAKTAGGVSGLMAALPRRTELPRAKGDVPAELIELALRAESGVEVELVTSRALPVVVQTPGGMTARPAAVVARFEARVRALSQQVTSVTMSRIERVAEDDARAMGLGVLRSDKGAPVVVGARLEAGDFRATIPILRDPKDVERLLGGALWRLDVARAGRHKVGIVCAAGAFCPRPEEPPRPARDEWPAPVAAAYDAIYSPFDEIRRELTDELLDVGLEPVAVEPGKPLPDGVRAVVLASPLSPVDTGLSQWLDALRAKGVGVIALLGGSRFVASAGKLVAIEGTFDGLLGPAGVSAETPLLADRAALIPFRAPGKMAKGAVPLPLAAEVFTIEAAHEAVSGSNGLVLPLSGSFGVPATSKAIRLLSSRPAASPVTLPSEASAGALERTAPPVGTAAPRVLAVAAPEEAGRGRLALVASGLGIESMSASTLLQNLAGEMDSLRANPAGLLRRLTPYAVASRAYLETLRANRALRLRVVALLARLVVWASVPPKIRGIAPSPAPAGE